MICTLRNYYGSALLWGTKLAGGVRTCNGRIADGPAHPSRDKCGLTIRRAAASHRLIRAILRDGPITSA